MKMFNLLKKLIYATSLAFSVITLSTFSTQAYAESKTATVYTKFTDQELVDILKKQYINVEIVKKGRILITFDNGGKLLIENTRQNGSLQFSVFYSDKDSDQVTQRQLNNWNRDYRFFKAYFTSEGSLIIDYDLETEGGISKEYLLSTIKNLFGVKSFFELEMSKDN